MADHSVGWAIGLFGEVMGDRRIALEKLSMVALCCQLRAAWEAAIFKIKDEDEDKDKDIRDKDNFGARTIEKCLL